MRDWICLGMLFACLSLAAQQPGQTPLSLEKEDALGKQLASHVLAHTAALSDVSVEAYVEEIGARLSAEMTDVVSPFTFKVIADDPCRATHEPVAFPGGYVFIAAALFREAQDEAEFAGMLAHAMRHVAHPLLSRGQLGSYGTIPLVFIGPPCSESMAVPSGFAAVQRKDDLAADALATTVLSQAGFDPAGLMRYIERAPTLRSSIQQLAAPASNASGQSFAAIRQKVLRWTELQDSIGPPPTLRRSSQLPINFR